MDFFEMVNSRRSVRQYSSQPVPRADLVKIVTAGIESPSGCNAQLRHYIIVDQPELMEAMRSLSNALTGAPAAIVLVMDAAGTRYGEYWIQDASAAMMSMLLAAEALGYASCWVEGAVRRDEAMLKQLLAVPENLRLWSLTPIGKSAVKPPRPEKSRFQDVVHFNKFNKG